MKNISIEELEHLTTLNPPDIIWPNTISNLETVFQVYVSQLILITFVVIKYVFNILCSHQSKLNLSMIRSPFN